MMNRRVLYGIVFRVVLLTCFVLPAARIMGQPPGARPVPVREDSLLRVTPSKVPASNQDNQDTHYTQGTQDSQKRQDTQDSQDSQKRQDTQDSQDSQKRQDSLNPQNTQDTQKRQDSLGTQDTLKKQDTQDGQKSQDIQAPQDTPAMALPPARPDSPEMTGFPEMTGSPELALPPEITASPGWPELPGMPLSGIPFSLESDAGLRLPAMKLPDFSAYLNSRWKTQGQASFIYPFSTGGARLFPGHIPLLMGGTATLFNQATYQLSNRLVIGGYSYGVNPPWVAPGLPEGNNRYDFRGASMFMQYKVSKNFRIETHVSVSGHPRQP